MVDGFDTDLMEAAPHAKRVKWHFAGVCQCLVGAFMVMDAFILMMQSESVIGEWSLGSGRRYVLFAATDPNFLPCC